MNGNGSAYGLPGNWAAKVMPEFEVELEEQDDEVYSKLGAFLAKLSDEGHGELAEELDSILFNLQESKIKKVQEGLDRAQWTTVREGKAISYSDVRQEYDSILAFLKKDILQKTGSKYVADALELLANDIRDQLHNPDPYDKDNWAYFDRDSGTQPNLNEAELNENALIDFAMLKYLWDNLKVPGVIEDFISKKGESKSINDKIDDWFKNNMGNPLVRGLYKALMMMGPDYGDRYDKQWERGELQEAALDTIADEFYNSLSEEAKSKAQQRFFGMVSKCQKEGDCASPEVEKAASSMKKKDVKDFAKTKHDGLPNKVPKEK